MYTLIRTSDHGPYLCERGEDGSLSIWNAAGENLARCCSEQQYYKTIQVVAQEFRRLESQRRRRRRLALLCLAALALGTAGIAGALPRTPAPVSNAYPDYIELYDWLEPLR